MRNFFDNLLDDGPFIKIFSNKMRRGPYNFNTPGISLSIGIGPFERRQKAVMDIDDILFLVEHGYIGFDKLKQITEDALVQVRDLNVDRSVMLARLAMVQEQSK